MQPEAFGVIPPSATNPKPGQTTVPANKIQNVAPGTANNGGMTSSQQ
jgi:hypothetical protein